MAEGMAEGPETSTGQYSEKKLGILMEIGNFAPNFQNKIEHILEYWPIQPQGSSAIPSAIPRIVL
jgi:hypothetical protein